MSTARPRSRVAGSTALRRSLLAGAAFLGLLVLDIGVAAQQASRQQLYVSIVDGQGQSIGKLSANDFEVREDGVLREVLDVHPATEPLEITVLVDNSAVSEPFIADMRKGLKALVTAIGPRNPIGMMTVAERPTNLINYSLDRAELQKAVDRLFAVPGSGSYLMQAIVQAAGGIRKRAPARSAIVVISAEGQEFSDLSDRQVLAALSESGAALHAVIIRQPGSTPPPVAAANADQEAMRYRAIVLDQGPRASGGRHDELLSEMAIAADLKKLADELMNQYLVTYARPDRLIPPRKVEVTAKRAGLTARATPARPVGGA